MSVLDIRAALAGPDLESVRGLCRLFRAWLYERYPDDKDLIDIYYNPEDFETLLADLPRIHAPPKGTILLANFSGSPAGCAMLKYFDAGICEMKRLFVSPECRGHGVGIALGEALLSSARQAGYQMMRLDTGPFHHEAKALYMKLGFTVRDAYYDPGPEWFDKLVYMERDLTIPAT